MRGESTALGPPRTQEGPLPPPKYRRPVPGGVKGHAPTREARVAMEVEGLNAADALRAYAPSVRPADLPPKLRNALTPAERFQQHASAAGVTPEELARDGSWARLVRCVGPRAASLVVPDAVMKLLALGPTFRERTQPRDAQTLVDASARRLERSLILSAYFAKKTGSDGELRPGWAPRSDWSPITHDPEWAGSSIGASVISIAQRAATRLVRAVADAVPEERTNVSAADAAARAWLWRNRDVVVPVLADKGMGIALMHASDYADGVRVHLSDARTYGGGRPNTHDARAELRERFNRGLDAWLDAAIRTDSVTEKMAGWLRAATRAARKDCCEFHAYPKLHKMGGDYTVQPPTRPVVASRAYYTTPLSKWASDALLKAHSLMPSYVQNAADAVALMEMLVLPDAAKLVEGDVPSMFTNVPATEESAWTVVAYMRKLLREGGRYAAHQALPDDRVLVRAILLVTTSHVIVSPDGATLYVQQAGLAMGSALSALFASLYLGAKEHALIVAWLRSGELLFYRRFADDVLAIFNGAHIQREDIVPQRLSHLWSDTPALSAVPWRVTDGVPPPDADADTTWATFLDIDMTLVQAIGGTVAPAGHRFVRCRVHEKPGHPYGYLPPTSYHRTASLHDWIGGEGLRLCRLSTCEEDFDVARARFRERLAERGYSDAVVHEQLSRVIYTSDRARLFERGSDGRAAAAGPPAPSVAGASPHFVPLRYMPSTEMCAADIARIVGEAQAAIADVAVCPRRAVVIAWSSARPMLTELLK